MADEKRILLVDSYPEVVMALGKTLKPPEWTIEEAPANADVLPRLQAFPYEVIVTGCMSAAGEDVELLRQIRRVSPRTRVIILAHEGTTTDVLNSMREHAFGFFQGRCAVPALIDMVEAAARFSSWGEDSLELLSGHRDWISVRANCHPTTADRLLSFFRAIKSDLPEQDREQIAIAFREILMNALEHGGNFDVSKFVDISYVRTRRTIVYYVRDPGDGFSINSLPGSALSNPANQPMRHLEYREERGVRPGGFGLLIAKELVDEVLYNEKGNEVLLIKYVI